MSVFQRITNFRADARQDAYSQFSSPNGKRGNREFMRCQPMEYRAKMVVNDMAKRAGIERPEVEMTCSVALFAASAKDGRYVIAVNPTAAETLTRLQFESGVAHEIGHLMRQSGKKSANFAFKTGNIWNVASIAVQFIACPLWAAIANIGANFALQARAVVLRRKNKGNAAGAYIFASKVWTACMIAMPLLFGAWEASAVLVGLLLLRSFAIKAVAKRDEIAVDGIAAKLCGSIDGLKDILEKTRKTEYAYLRNRIIWKTNKVKGWLGLDCAGNSGHVDLVPKTALARAVGRAAYIIFSSHPTAKKRIAELEKLNEELAA
jgi:Zn-dependent protease with chaperone function